MEQAFKKITEILPDAGNGIPAQFPFCGTLQVMSASGDICSSTEMSLFFPLPVPVHPPAELNPINTEPLIFEPYHTIDYFASQGVAPPPLENATDRFGQQLKSFTDWLKVMKRLPLTEITRQIPVEKEKQVAALAHHSLDEKQVWTEAMAEVWIKQGERQKAIRIYEKLSLLEPSKSAYFAGRIDELKKES